MEFFYDIHKMQIAVRQADQFNAIPAHKAIIFAQSRCRDAFHGLHKNSRLRSAGMHFISRKYQKLQITVTRTQKITNNQSKKLAKFKSQVKKNDK